MVWFTLDPLNEKKIRRPISAGLQVSKYYQKFSFCFPPDLRSRKDERISNICSRKGFKTAGLHLVNIVAKSGKNIFNENGFITSRCKLVRWKSRNFLPTWNKRGAVEKKESSCSIFENFNWLQKGLAVWAEFPQEVRQHRKNFKQIYLPI